MLNIKLKINYNKKKYNAFFNQSPGKSFKIIIFDTSFLEAKSLGLCGSDFYFSGHLLTTVHISSHFQPDDVPIPYGVNKQIGHEEFPSSADLDLQASSQPSPPRPYYSPACRRYLYSSAYAKVLEAEAARLLRNSLGLCESVN